MHSASELSGLRDVLDSRFWFDVTSFYPDSLTAPFTEKWIEDAMREIASWCLLGFNSLQNRYTKVRVDVTPHPIDLHLHPLLSHFLKQTSHSSRLRR